ncbi:MAG TPA: Yip1 family protein [Vicinamibacterales bacterium]|nr:Yip1 family protein [Vicinamibacterales bacterium]
MTLVDRVRNICVSPNTEWPVIEQERTSPSELVTGYLLPLAAIGAVASFIGSSFIGVFGIRASLVSGLVTACLMIVMTMIGCFVIGLIINALAPTFGGRQDANQAFKTSVYCYTPVLVGGIANLLPAIGTLIGFVAAIYSLYLLYLGLPVMMKAPQDKAPAYTLVVVVCSIVLGAVIAFVFAAFGLAGASML